MAPDPPAPPLPAAHLAALIDVLPEWVLVLDRDACVVHANARLLDAMGYRPEDVVGRGVYEFVHPDDLAYLAGSFDLRSAAPGQPGLIVQARGRAADGTWHPAELIGVSLLDDPAHGVFVITMRDLSGRPALADAPERLQSLLDRASDILVLVDADGRIVYANRRLASQLGHDNDAMVGTSWSALVSPGDRHLTATWFGDLLHAAPGATARLRTEVTTGLGETRQVEWHATNQLDDPLVRGVLLSGRDISAVVDLERQMRRQHDELAYAATHDALTGLVNRAEFLRLLGRALGDGTGATISVLFGDLDGFKAVNDVAGHETGDRVLRAVAERLRRQVRATDVLARYGGDEFAVLLAPGTGRAEVRQVAARLTGSLAAPVDVDGTDHTVGITIGEATAVASDAAGPAAVDDLVRRADAAMYEAKRSRPA